jgi:hypothetical protein
MLGVLERGNNRIYAPLPAAGIDEGALQNVQSNHCFGRRYGRPRRGGQHGGIARPRATTADGTSSDANGPTSGIDDSPHRRARVVPLWP